MQRMMLKDGISTVRRGVSNAESAPSAKVSKGKNARRHREGSAEDEG